MKNASMDLKVIDQAPGSGNRRYRFLGITSEWLRDYYELDAFMKYAAELTSSGMEPDMFEFDPVI